MRILILGTNGFIGKLIFSQLEADKSNKIIGTYYNTSNEINKKKIKIDLKKNIKKLFFLIEENNFDLIVNCLFIRNNKGKYETNVPKKIVNFINLKNINIQWVEISTYSIFFKYKTDYSKKKILFEKFLEKKFANNLKSLKIIRIGNFIEEKFLKNLIFFRFFSKKNIFIPSYPFNNVFITKKKLIRNFFEKDLNNDKMYFNLVIKYDLKSFFSTFFKDNKIIFMKINNNYFCWIKNLLCGNIKNKFLNFINLFYS